jgi:hypothetical protein
VRKPRGVPRDEWLLAVGLARFKKTWPQPHGPTHDYALAISGRKSVYQPYARLGSDHSAAYCGADSVLRPFVTWRDEENPDAYAAGAALAMALESS